MKAMLVGILFTVLYASGAVAMKFGLLSGPPLKLSVVRFFIAAGLMLGYLYIVRRGKYVMPTKSQLKVLALLGLLNTAMFLGLGLVALKFISSGIFNLFVPINTFLYALLAFVFLGQVIQKKEWLGMFIAFAGLLIATIPSLRDSFATPGGLILMMLAVASMATGSIVFKKSQLQLPAIVTNAWQVAFGAIILIVPALLLERGEQIIWDMNLLYYLLWSVLALSIFNINLWYYLLRQDAVHANNWLLLNPVAGYILATIMLGEPLTSYAMVGTLVVLFGLYLSGNLRFKHS